MKNLNLKEILRRKISYPSYSVADPDPDDFGPLDPDPLVRCVDPDPCPSTV
jgi:hypothetical protein